MDVLKRTAARFFIERYYDRAAQTAYYLLLSTVPFLIFMLSLVGYFPVDQSAVLDFVKPFAPAETYSLIEENVRAILSEGRGGIVSISLIGAFWLSSMAVQSLSRTLNAAYGSRSTLPGWRKLLHSFGVTLLFMILVPVSLLLPFIEQALQWLASYVDVLEDWSVMFYVWQLVRWGLGSLFIFVFFLVFFSVVPNQPLRFFAVLPGAIVSTIGWQAVSWLFARYSMAFSYSQLYGQLSGIIILVLWFYLTASVVLFSGLLNAEYLKWKYEK